MKNIPHLLGLAAAFLLAALPGRADTLLVTITGNVSQFDANPAFWDSSVALGTPVTMVFQIDTGSTPDPSSAPTEGYYSDYSHSSTFTLGNYTFVNNEGNFVDIYASSSFSEYVVSASNGGIPLQYGLNLLAFGATLEFSDPSQLTGTGLSDVVSTSVSDFSTPTLNLLAYDSSNNSTRLTATVTSFNVATVPTPEPSTWALLAVGAAAAGLLGFRRLRQTA